MALSFDSKLNFAYSVVATAPSPATTGTSLIVAPSTGSLFPSTPFNAVVWPSGVQPTTTNAEVVRVTNIATDTFTIVREQEGSTARSITINDQIAANITAKALTDIEDAFQTASASISPVGVIDMWLTGTPPTGWLILDGSDISRTTYSELFALWGTTFGAGDGSTTFTLPDMQQYMPIGKSATLSTLGATGGSLNHSHDSGTLAVASHTHDSGTLTVASHTHSSGTLAVASHTHGPGTLTVTGHTHSISLDTSFTDISHTHTTPNHTHTYSGTTGGPSGTTDASNTTTDVHPANDVHTHTFSGTTGSGGGSTTGSGGGSHRHAVTGSSASAAPTIGSGLTASTAPSVSSGSTGATAPSVSSGVTGGTAPAVSSGTTGTSNPPYFVVNYIVRALSAI